MWRRRRRHLLYIPLKKSRVSDGCLREKTSMSRYILGEGEVESRGFWAPQSFCLRFGISLDLQSRTFIQSGLVQVYLLHVLSSWLRFCSEAKKKFETTGSDDEEYVDFGYYPEVCHSATLWMLGELFKLQFLHPMTFDCLIGLLWR